MDGAKVMMARDRQFWDVVLNKAMKNTYILLMQYLHLVDTIDSKNSILT